ncbi:MULTISPECIES: right-handed parallel beta-helix repeat-containing protein [Micromonospora]|uniref:Right handed beta helix domain-containing protein n=1 Tax=Micromonospora haikouensis TaxID=686309 RepID=A0A0D0WQS8_9ACTN|nr:right-handed parallel beta-helix repeat-containing protein [Micromonospora haikouensis]KIR61361.1 hypothetical protein TK50_27225 [Micromonospora haikouensis]
MIKNKRRLAVLCVASVLATAVPLLVTGPASAATVTVSAGADLQAAMDRLRDLGCGTLLVNPGTYTLAASLKVYDGCTVQGTSASDRPVITLAVGRDEPVVTNASVPFTNVGIRNAIVLGGLGGAEQAYPSYFHKGGAQYNERISSGTETKASLDARIEAARINRIGIDFSDKHQDVVNVGAVVENVLVERAAMGIIIGRATGVTIRDTDVQYNGAVQGYFHGLYLSIVDQVVIDGLNASHNVTGIGLKVTDFYNANTETSVSIRNSDFNYNYDRGTAVYYLQNAAIVDNVAHHNGSSGFNILWSTNGSLINNQAYDNPLVANVSYDIWLNGCSGFTISGNTYGSSRGI